MAKTKKPNSDTNDGNGVETVVGGPRPKLKSLEISNFRAIGKTPVRIDLDDIVVLVGSNNAGKSSILKAYQLVMLDGSNDGKLQASDFPNETTDTEDIPTIILTTAVVDENKPGAEWISRDVTSGEQLVTERWTWPTPGAALRQGFNVEKNDWVKEVPWGAANVANSRRPKPYRVDAFESPENQSKEIIKIISDSLDERLLAIQDAPDGDTPETENEFKKILGKITDLQKRVLLDSQEQIRKIEEGISGILQSVFPRYVVKFDVNAEAVDSSSISFFKTGGRLLMGPADGFKGAVSHHGSGARRTLLWSALKFINDAGLKKGRKKDDQIDRPHILLIDEPELCLHPSAVRQACRVLYDLPNSGNWQVMVTTHSPIFIDLSRDNTTIVRVDRSDSGVISSCTLFKAQQAKLTEDERSELKLLNLFDPYVAEFFFGGSVVIVEGDTEYAALKYVAEREGISNVQIIRARGKSTIVSLSKILNQFSAKYSILHDSDRPKITVDGKVRVNSAWTVNSNILKEVAPMVSSGKVRLLASLPNFEKAYLDSRSTSGEKPYTALLKIQQDAAAYKELVDLLRSLTDFAAQPPSRCLEWTDITHLESEVAKVV